MFRNVIAILCVLCIAYGTNLPALPATRAHLSIPSLKALVLKSWKTEINKYGFIIDQAMHQETVYYNTHHVFYHAQKSDFYVLHDFLKALYCFIHPDLPHIEDFHFLRAWHDFPATINAHDFIEAHEGGIPQSWNDNKPDLSKQMLSVNFSLFGSTKNYGHFGECTFKYFFSNKSIKTPDVKNLFQSIFTAFELDTKYIPELLELQNIIKTNEGLLFQIFIPHNMVDQIAFAAQRLGTPYRNETLLPDLFDPIKERYPALFPILEMYCHRPYILGDVLDRLQGRLLFSQNMLLNPFCGVKIFRYNTIEKENVKTYQEKFKKLLKRIFRQWIGHLAREQRQHKFPVSEQRVSYLIDYYTQQP